MQFDIKTAFLNGDFEENILMSLQEKTLPNKVSKLKKGIFGLKQSPKNCNIKFSSILRRFGMISVNSNRCFYPKLDENIFLIE